MFISGIRRNSVSASRVIQNAAARGKSTSFIGLSLALLTRISRPTLRAQVKKFEKYIIKMKPLSPETGRNIKIKIILRVESVIAVRKLKACWSSPFKMPSDTLSKYISGTIGESALKREPTSSLL